MSPTVIETPLLPCCRIGNLRLPGPFCFSIDGEALRAYYYSSDDPLQEVFAGCVTLWPNGTTDDESRSEQAPSQRARQGTNRGWGSKLVFPEKWTGTRNKRNQRWEPAVRMTRRKSQSCRRPGHGRTGQLIDPSTNTGNAKWVSFAIIPEGCCLFFLFIHCLTPQP